MDAPPINRHPQITNLRKPIWLRGAVMGVSRFPIRPGVDLRNINSASPRGAIFLQPATWRCQYPDKGRYAPPVQMIKLTATLQRDPELPDWRVSRKRRDQSFAR